MREDRGEVDLALNNALPKLIERTDYRGDLHCHTTASDGSASIEQMAEAAIARGYEFLAITDHSKSQAIANGLSVERLLAHVKEIHKVGEKLGKKIKLLAGSEVDILVDGRLDYEDAVLKELDFVVASPHVSLKQDEAKATDRIVRAIENRYVNVIGHPTGRLINERTGLTLNFKRIYQAARDTGTALEINAGWPRLDLNDVNARGAIDAGVMLSINTDAHAIEQLDGIGLGFSVARRAWVTKDHVINCMSAARLLKFIDKKRKN
jgi:DNA polymerase (family 10)